VSHLVVIRPGANQSVDRPDTLVRARSSPTLGLTQTAYSLLKLRRRRQSGVHGRHDRHEADERRLDARSRDAIDRIRVEMMGARADSGLGHLARPRCGRRIKAEPLQALRESLEVARASGMAFDSAWESSVESALSGYRGLVRRDWSSAIRETREVWRSAYLVEPNARLERWAGVLQTA
jgi:hypothetical protein